MSTTICTPARHTADEKWMIVNFTQKEFLAPHTKTHGILRHYIGLFEKDKDGYSRWMTNDSISWVSTRDPLASLLRDFQDVYGYKTTPLKSTR